MATSPLVVVEPEGDLILDVGSELLSKQGEDAVPPPADGAVSASSAANQTVDQPENASWINTADIVRRTILECEGKTPVEAYYAMKQEVSPSSTGESRQILVCSKVLKRISPFFRAQIDGLWADGKEHADRDDKGRMVLRYPEDDPSAMLLLCKILHHQSHNNQAPNYYSLHSLAVLTDKIGCYNALQVWFRSQWRERLQIGQEDFLIGFPMNTCAHALQVMKMSYRLRDRTWFAFASALYAYTQNTRSIASGLRDIWIKDEIELPEELIGKQHLYCRTTDITNEAFVGQLRCTPFNEP